MMRTDPRVAADAATLGSKAKLLRSNGYEDCVLTLGDFASQVVTRFFGDTEPTCSQLFPDPLPTVKNTTGSAIHGRARCSLQHP